MMGAPAIRSLARVQDDPICYISDFHYHICPGWLLSVSGETVMRNPNLQKEEFSYAYVHAVAAHAGFFCERPIIDCNSVDLSIISDHRISSKSIITPKIDFQLKATSKHSFENGFISFPLNVKNYNELKGDTSVPILLIVFIMPDVVEDWLDHNEERLITRKCAYWCNLRDSPNKPNVSKVHVQINQKNLFSPTSLKELMLKASMYDGKGVGFGI